MSLCMFFASDTQFEVFNNAIQNENSNYLKKQKNKTKKRNEETSEVMTTYLNNKMIMSESFFIFEMEDMNDAGKYTKKKYCADIEWTFSDKNADLAIKYIAQCMSKCRDLELWSIWMGETSKSESRTKVEFRRVKLKDLSSSALKDIWGQEWYTNPICLIIEK